MTELIYALAGATGIGNAYPLADLERVFPTGDMIMTGVLDDLQVLDLSWGIAGPMTTMLLADHGAMVTKIEPPGGDPFRCQSGYRAWHRGKRSAVLDLKARGDRESFLALTRDADILVESYTPGVTDRLGIDYATLSALNPRLIYCSITAYGRNNRHSGRPGYDALVAARTGLHWEQRGWPEGPVRRMAGQPDCFADVEMPADYLQGPPRPGPVFPAVPYPSLGAFYAASVAISAALRAREITGRGQWVETSLLQGALACANDVWQRAENVDAPMFDSWIYSSRSPKGHFQCADGRWVHNWVPSPRFILTVADGDDLRATGELQARNDPDRIGTGPEEIVVLRHYQPLLAERMRRFPAAKWVEAAAAAGITLQAVRSADEALRDPLLLADGCVAEVADPELGAIRHVGIAYQLDTSPGKIRGPAPSVGEHTHAVKAEVAALPARTARTGRAGQALCAPLDGIRVLDFGLALAGPFGTQILSDLGAEVIKINAPHDGYWHSTHIAFRANRGKRSLAIDLKHPRALEILQRLVQSADVLQHNMRYAAAERLRIDYARMRQINPKLIYCHTRGHERGPRAPLPANEQTAGCLAGVQYEDGGMGRGGKPFWSFTSLGDTGNGFLSAVAIIQALYHRERTGAGQMCTTAIINAQLLNCSSAVATADGGSLARPRLDGMQLGFSATHRLYATADGWLCIVLASEPHWRRLCAVLGRDDLTRDVRFESSAARACNDGALATILEEAFVARPATDWYAALDRAGVPVEICDPEFGRRLHDDAEMIERGWVVSYAHPAVGRLGQIGLFFDFSGTPGRVQGPPPIVGQHTQQILAELGYSNEQIEQFGAEGVVAQAPTAT
ncbi:MAG: CoA transferase [Candidatus Binatia bacterium]